jgi:hypothetical protein
MGVKINRKFRNTQQKALYKKFHRLRRLSNWTKYHNMQGFASLLCLDLNTSDKSDDLQDLRIQSYHNFTAHAASQNEY